MKSWLKIIRGESEKTSKEIAKEIEGVEKEIQNTQTKAEGLREDLKHAGIERLAGESTEKTITKLETELRNVERDLELFEDVRKSLVEKQGEAIQKEKAARVDEIDKEIELIRATKNQMRENARTLGAELAGFLFLCNGVGHREISNLMAMSHDEGIKFRSAVEKLIDGRIPFMEEERKLMIEKKELRG